MIDSCVACRATLLVTGDHQTQKESVVTGMQGANVTHMQLLASAGVPSFVSILPFLCSRAPYVVTNGFYSNNYCDRGFSRYINEPLSEIPAVRSEICFQYTSHLKLLASYASMKELSLSCIRFFCSITTGYIQSLRIGTIGLCRG